MNAYPAAAERTSSEASASNLIDLRSDTVTKPDAGMYDAIRSAPLGDDVYGDDPTVNRLQETVAALLGKEDALLFPTGTQSNLAAVMGHCGRGEELIIGRGYHIATYEAMGSAVLGSVAATVIPTATDGSVSAADIAAAVKPADTHFPISRLLCLENTHSGKVVSMDSMADAAAAARRHGLAVHLDGARLMNAAVALKTDPSAIAAHTDTVSLCLSKGLGTPAGSVLAGPSDLIDRARRVRKMLGGGMRQAGVIAACGLYALENNVERLADDHANAARLAGGLRKLAGQGVTVTAADTNMLFVEVDPGLSETLPDRLAARGVRISGRSGTLRLVVHLGVSGDDIEHIVAAFADACAAG